MCLAEQEQFDLQKFFTFALEIEDKKGGKMK